VLQLHAGGLVGGFCATNLGRSTVFGIEGWRCAFHLVALVSIVTSVCTLWLAVDPRKKLAVSLFHHSTSVADSCEHDRTSASQLTGVSVCLSHGGAVLNRDQHLHNVAVVRKLRKPWREHFAATHTHIWTFRVLTEQLLQCRDMHDVR